MKKYFLFIFTICCISVNSQNIATTPSGSILTNDVNSTIRGIPYQTKRVSYTVIASDTVQGYSAVAISFNTAFSDTNYTATFSVDYYKALSVDAVVNQGPITNKTASGFNAIMVMPIGIKRYIGQKLTINAIAIHD